MRGGRQGKKGVLNLGATIFQERDYLEGMAPGETLTLKGVYVESLGGERRHP